MVCTYLLLPLLIDRDHTAVSLPEGFLLNEICFRPEKGKISLEISTPLSLTIYFDQSSCLWLQYH